MMCIKFFRVLTVFLLLFSTSLIISNDAYAKRFGGGKSMGMQRSMTQRHTASPVNQPMGSAANAMSSSGRFGKWGAALAGLAAGGLLSYLLMGHGLGASMLSWLAIAMVGLLIMQFFRQRRLQTASPLSAQEKPLSFSEHIHPTSQSASPVQPAFSGVTPIMQGTSIPGFHEDTFLREAKAIFYRLQTAYDQKNLSDIREFTMPEVFAEIQLQLSERGHEENNTDVITLHADLLEAINEFQVPIASVRFSGELKEAKDVPPVSFNEIWHFRSDTLGRWKIAGIQQQQ